MSTKFPIVNTSSTKYAVAKKNYRQNLDIYIVIGIGVIFSFICPLIFWCINKRKDRIKKKDVERRSNTSKRSNSIVVKKPMKKKLRRSVQKGVKKIQKKKEELLRPIKKESKQNDAASSNSHSFI
ncbi:hypothetical protein SNEBB_001072 [Seison nebaliae]|nr:hypothetical protein SNEBB_001072 [Seison nebaliae]